MFNSVLVEVFTNLTSDIRTKISRLGEDTTTDSGKYAYNWNSERESSNKLEKDQHLVGNLSLGSSASNIVNNAWSVSEDKNFKDCDSKTGKDESKCLTAGYGCLERGFSADVSLVGYFEICISCNLNANISNEHLCDASEQKGEGRVGEADKGVVVFPGQIDSTDNKNWEENHQHGDVGVLLAYENVGTLIKVVILFNPEEKMARHA